MLFVRDHIPLEQGLRRAGNQTQESNPSVRDHIPLEQGLRRAGNQTQESNPSVRDHIPLEQGLRPNAADCSERGILSETIFH